MTNDDGFVFAATGAQYRGLACRAARSLRAVLNDVQIDLFADEPVDDPVFDQVHPLQHKGKRPKIEAMRKSRFQYTVYLDCDVVTVADCSDLFELLRQMDCIGAQAQYGNGTVSMREPRLSLPVGFRQINSGVMGVRKSDATQAFLTKWEKRMDSEGESWDQPILKELLWDSALRFWVLPLEYNLMHISYIPVMGKLMAAPRLLHVTKLHGQPGFDIATDSPFDLSEVMDHTSLKALYEILGRDRTLINCPTARDQIGSLLHRQPMVKKQARSIWRRLR